MDDTILIWDLEDDPDGNVAHIAEHGITVEDVEDVMGDPDASTGISRSSGSPITFGETSDGRHIAVVWEQVLDDPRMVRVVTAYEAPRPRRRR